MYIRVLQINICMQSSPSKQMHQMGHQRQRQYRGTGIRPRTVLLTGSIRYSVVLSDHCCQGTGGTFPWDGDVCKREKGAKREGE